MRAVSKQLHLPSDILHVGLIPAKLGVGGALLSHGPCRDVRIFRRTRTEQFISRCSITVCKRPSFPKTPRNDRL